MLDFLKVRGNEKLGTLINYSEFGLEWRAPTPVTLSA